MCRANLLPRQLLSRERFCMLIDAAPFRAADVDGLDPQSHQAHFLLRTKLGMEIGTWDFHYQHMHVIHQWFMQALVSTHTHTHTHTQTHTHTHTQLPGASLRFMAVPKALILGLPFTSEMISQTWRKASSVHFLKYKCRNLFCSVRSIVIVIVLWSPSVMML